MEVSCPLGHATMTLAHVQDHSLDVCGVCGGVWLDGEEVEQLLAVPPSADQVSSPSAWASADFITPLVGEALGRMLDGV